METRFDPGAFIFGVLFLTVAGVGLLDTAALRTVNFGQLIALVLVVSGVALLASTLFKRDGHTTTDMPPPGF